MRTRDRIHDDIIEGLPPNNNKFYLKHKPGSLTVKIKSEEGEKSNLFNLIKLSDKAQNVEENKKTLRKLKEV